MKRAFNVDTSELVSFRTGGIARELAVAETRQELLDVLSEANSLLGFWLALAVLRLSQRAAWP